jgi:hypothetical protein
MCFLSHPDWIDIGIAAVDRIDDISSSEYGAHLHGQDDTNPGTTDIKSRGFASKSAPD